VVAPDLPGFGRSDKPVDVAQHSFGWHRQVLLEFVQRLDLQRVRLVVQDWGGLLGLTLPMEAPGRYEGLLVMNTFLATAEEPLPEGFRQWRAMCRSRPDFGIGRLLARGNPHLTAAECAAYDAPFPSDEFKLAARIFPGLVPVRPDDPERANNESAWEVFRHWDRPFLTLFSDRDPITRGGDRIWQETVPGARGQPHATIRHAGHFLQEDAGPELAERLVAFMNP